LPGFALRELDLEGFHLSMPRDCLQALPWEKFPWRRECRSWAVPICMMMVAAAA